MLGTVGLSCSPALLCHGTSRCTYFLAINAGLAVTVASGVCCDTLAEGCVLVGPIGLVAVHVDFDVASNFHLGGLSGSFGGVFRPLQRFLGGLSGSLGGVFRPLQRFLGGVAERDMNPDFFYSR
jgi:hypothetical protein